MYKGEKTPIDERRLYLAERGYKEEQIEAILRAEYAGQKDFPLPQ